MIDIDRTRPKTKAEQESEVERVYRTLKSWLIEARLPPGDFLQSSIFGRGVLRGISG